MNRPKRVHGIYETEFFGTCLTGGIFKRNEQRVKCIVNHPSITNLELLNICDETNCEKCEFYNPTKHFKGEK